MKKLLALFLSISLVLSAIPFNVSAEEVKQPCYDTLVDKAVSAFPEYAAKILNPSYSPSNNSRSAARVLVVNQTRSISDTESITYAEYSDGLILLSDYSFTCDSTVVSSSSGSTYRTYTVDIQAACVVPYYNGFFYLNGVTYTIHDGDNNFDSITSPGTARKGTNCNSATREDYTENESYTGYARIAYHLGFRIGPSSTQFVTSKLTFHVGEDSAILDHIDWN